MPIILTILADYSLCPGRVAGKGALPAHTVEYNVSKPTAGY